jgi:hypothetical protein
MAIGDVTRATDDNAEQARVAAELYCDLCSGWADATHAFIALHTGRLAEAAALAEAAFRRGVAEDVQGLQGNSFHTWSEAMLELDDDDGLAHARAVRGPSVERLADCYAALRTGDYDRAKRIGETLANWRTREGREAYVSVADALLAQGHFDEAEQILHRVEPLLVGDGASLLAQRRVRWAQAELAARRGDVVRALADLDAQAAECAAHDLTYCEIRSAALAIELTRDPEDARRRAALLLDHARSSGFNRVAREVEAVIAR